MTLIHLRFGSVPIERAFVINTCIKLREIYLGDIIISFNYMNKSKSPSSADFKENVIKIFIHGFLHLLDFDHIKKKDYIKMLNEEQKIFKSVQKFIN